MSLFNNKEILTELTAIRLGLQFYLDSHFSGAPDIGAEAYNRVSSSNAMHESEAQVLTRDARKAYQPTDIITPDYEQQVIEQERANHGDDTEEMIKQAFRNEFGSHAIMALEAKTEPAVGLYETFRANWYYQQSKLGG